MALKIVNRNCVVKRACYDCGYLSTTAHNFYKCKVPGTCPAVAAPRHYAPTTRNLSEDDSFSIRAPDFSTPASSTPDSAPPSFSGGGGDFGGGGASGDW